MKYESAAKQIQETKTLDYLTLARLETWIYNEANMGETRYIVKLDRRGGNNGRWGTVTGRVSPRVGRVSVLVFSHDEQWHHQKPAILAEGTEEFSTEVAFGNEPLSPLGREYIVVAYVGPDLQTEGTYRSLNDLPADGQLSAPISVHRIDP